MSIDSVLGLSACSDLTVREILNLSVSELYEIATVWNLDPLDYAQVYLDYRRLGGAKQLTAETNDSPLTCLSKAAGGIPVSVLRDLSQAQLKQLTRDILQYSLLDHTKVYKEWSSSKQQVASLSSTTEPTSTAHRVTPLKQGVADKPGKGHEDATSKETTLQKDVPVEHQEDHDDKASASQESDRRGAADTDLEQSVATHKHDGDDTGEDSDNNANPSTTEGIASESSRSKSEEEEQVDRSANDDDWWPEGENVDDVHSLPAAGKPAAKVGSPDDNDDDSSSSSGSTCDSCEKSQVVNNSDTNGDGAARNLSSSFHGFFSSLRRRSSTGGRRFHAPPASSLPDRRRTYQEVRPEPVGSGGCSKRARYSLDDRVVERPHKDCVLLSYHKMNATLRSMGIYHNQCVYFNHMMNPNAPTGAGLNGSVEEVRPSVRGQGRFHAFAQRTLTYIKRETLKPGKSLGWEYLGLYEIDQSDGDSLGKSAFLKAYDPNDDPLVWDRATNFSLSSRRDMAMKILRSASSSSLGTFGRAYLDYWRARLEHEIAQQEETERRNGLAPVVGPKYMVEQRQPTQRELKERDFNLAARARALNYKKTMDDTHLADLIVELSEFHRMVSIRFVEYDKGVYRALEREAKTNVGANGIKIRAGDPCAKANDWYEFFDKERLAEEERARQLS